MYSRIRLKLVRDGQTLIDSESPLRILNGNYMFAIDGAKYFFDNKLLVRPNNMPQFFSLELENVCYDDNDNYILIHYEHEMETRFTTDITINLY